MAMATRGDRVGKYEILTPLTMGGMAELFIGTTMGPGGFQKHVVIKRILPDASRDEGFMRMFLDEARITAGFNHPNIAQVYDLGEDEQGLYVVMEFIPGQNLNQVVSTCAKQQHVLPLGFSASVINDCALALHYAHTYVKPSGESYPVVHRDVAQKNIMVAWDGQTKLLDFGIAKAANTLSRTKVGTVKGTAGYMSPEQVMGKPVDGRSDVFSLGVVAWEMVTGQRLFSAETELAEMKLILDGKVQRPDVVEPVVPPELADVIMRAVAREPADRYLNARDFSKALTSRCGDLLFDQEQRSLFMRELFADRIEKTQKLFDLSKAKKDATVDVEVRQLAKSIQESAMSQPVLTPIKGRPRVAAGNRKPRSKQRSAEDEKLLDLAIRVDQVATGTLSGEPPPKRTWGGFIILALVVLLVGGLANKVFFPDKRVSSSGLVMWDGEPEEPPDDPNAPRRPSDGPPPAVVADPSSIPGASSEDPPPEVAPGNTEPITTPPPPRMERLEKVEVKKPKPPPPALAATGEVTLALLPEATVFRGKEELAKGTLVSFKLPPGTHMLTILGTDGVKRRLSLPVVSGKNPARRFKLEDLPAQ
ncbi:MAG: serine/threonine-protein kinase [Myxococcaceae bacterium]|nr:serine/threonine-protein kinase [Myxococcaceae bacterium]